jgi:DNA-binding CsgD family transcriptional regulator
MDQPQARNNFGLSGLELKILSEVVAGYSNEEIAERIAFSLDNVKLLLYPIFDKLGVSSREELIRFAVDHKLCLGGAAKKVAAAPLRGPLL